MVPFHEDVKSTVCGQLVKQWIVTGRLGCYSHAEWCLLSSLPSLPDALDKQKNLRKRDGLVLENARLNTLLLVKSFRRNYCTQSLMFGGTPSCIKKTESRHCRCCKWGTTTIFSILLYLFAFTVYVAGLLGVASPKEKNWGMNVGVNPHQTITFGEWSRISWKVRMFSLSQMRKLRMFH